MAPMLDWLQDSASTHCMHSARTKNCNIAKLHQIPHTSSSTSRSCGSWIVRGFYSHCLDSVTTMFCLIVSSLYPTVQTDKQLVVFIELLPQVKIKSPKNNCTFSGN